MNSNSHGRRVHQAMRLNEKLKNDITHLKQGQSSQRLQYEQVNTELNNKLAAREGTIQEMNKKLAEKERMLEQFRRLHGGGGGSGGISSSRTDGNDYQVSAIQPHHSQHDHASISHTSHHIPPSGGGGSQRSIGGGDPPLKGLMMQRQKQQAAQHQAFNRRRGPMNMSSSASIQSSITGVTGMGGGRTNRRGMADGMGPAVTRPFSSSLSTGSNSLSSVTPRVRDLSRNTGFSFSGGNSSIGGGSTGGAGSGQRLNKRRRSDATPMSNHNMSPNTAFTLNQGNHSVNRGQQRWRPRDSSGSFSRR